jgi:prefoldin subunit 5
LSGRIIFAAVKPIKEDLVTIKGQLDQVNTTLQDLTRRIEEIERLVKEEQKKKVRVA